MQKNKLLQKLTAMLLIFTLTFANFALVSKSYAASFAETLFGSNSDTGHKNIEFKAYFGSLNNKDENEDTKVEQDRNVKEISSDVNNNELAIKLNLNVLDLGYLKNAKIELVEAEEGKQLNFEIGKNGINEKSQTQIKPDEVNGENEEKDIDIIEGNIENNEEILEGTYEENKSEESQNIEVLLDDNSEIPNEDENEDKNEAEDGNENDNKSENNNKIVEAEISEKEDNLSSENQNEILSNNQNNINQDTENDKKQENTEVKNEEQKDVELNAEEKNEEEQSKDNSSNEQQEPAQNDDKQTSGNINNPEQEIDNNSKLEDEEQESDLQESNNQDIESQNVEEQEENVELEGTDNTEGELIFPEYVESLENNVLYLDQINSTSEINIDLPIRYKNEEYVKRDIVSNKCKVRFSGIYVDGEGKEHDVGKEEILTLNWTDEREVIVETGTTKYIDFGDGVILQTIIRTNNEEAGNRLPIEKSEIEIEVPSLANAKPSNVLVVANSLEGTNGEKAGNLNFGENNWSYNSDENKVQIEVNNEEKLVKSSDYSDEIILEEEEKEEPRLFNGNGTDEYLVTFTYPGITIEDAEKSMISNIKAKFTSLGGIESTNDNNYQYDLNNSQGNIVSLNIENETKEISKAYSYINYNNEGKYEIELLSDSVINVSYKDIIKDLKLEDVQNTYIDKEGNEQDTEDIYYKRIEISKENFDKMLGEAGEIRILSQDGENINEVGKINNSIEANEEGNIVLEIESRYSKLNFEITKPISEGNIIIKSVKAISNLGIDKTSLINMAKISSKTKLKADYEYVEDTVEVEEKALETVLKDTSSNASIKLDRESLSTLSANENVEIRVELNNASKNSDIYGHSVFEIELPEYIESLEITDTKMLYGEGLDIKEIVAEGRTIRITIDGIQDGINSGTYVNGANIVIIANIKVNLYTPAKKEKVKLRYTNDEATFYENDGYSEFDVSYSAPTGLVAVNCIEGYKEGAKVQSVRQGKKTDLIDIYSERKEAQDELIVMNNNGNEITNVRILGRFPFEGAKDILSGDNLGTTLNTKILSGITSDERNRGNFKIYYSENEEATSDLESIENKWQEEIENFDNIKSYLIVPEDEYVMEDTEVLRFTYRFEIPENLNHNENIFGTFMVEYKNNSNIMVSDEREIADLVGLTTGEGPEIEVEVVPDKNEVREYDELIYTMKITNIGENRVENITGEFPIPSGTKYVDFESNYDGTEVSLEERKKENNLDIPVDSEENHPKATIRYLSIKSPIVETDEELEINLKFKISSVNMYVSESNEDNKIEFKELDEFPEKYIEAKGYITAKELGKNLEFETEKVKVLQASIKVEQRILSPIEVYPVGAEIEFRIGVQNLSKNSLKNITITQELPEELEYVKSSIYKYEKNENENKAKYTDIEAGTFNTDTNEIIWNLEELIGQKDISNLDDYSLTKVYFKYTVKVKDITDGSTKRKLQLNATAESDEIGTYETEPIDIEIGKPVLVITQTSNNTNTYIKAGETVNYTFLIKNEGGAKATNIELKDEVPDGMIADKVRLTDSLGQVQERNVTSDDATISTYELNPGEEITADVELKADYLRSAETSVTNFGLLSQDNNSEIKTNGITHIIEGNPQTVVNEEEGTSRKLSLTNEDNISQTYKIEGTAWEDSNKNGMRDSGEPNLSGISVKLINSGGAVEKTSTTDANGRYSFAGISSGSYSVIFEYDTSKYVVTAYQKQGVNLNVNNDAISTRLEQNGKITYGAITDVINITNSSVSSIDLGLMLSEKFDLKIDKTITKITVQTNKGTTTENYNNVKLAKTEIASKNVTGSVVYVEYEIKVSNVGDISGFAKKIVDYVPDGMKFNSSLESNSKWYTGTDGNLYTKAFENTELKKGDTKTIKLVLTKNMTSENTGISNNKAEIAEDYNIYGLTDTNSTPGNKVQNENDISSADSVILIKTGETFIYISVIVTSLLLGGIMIFIVYSKIEDIKRKAGV